MPQTTEEIKEEKEQKYSCFTDYIGMLFWGN